MVDHLGKEELHHFTAGRRVGGGLVWRWCLETLQVGVAYLARNAQLAGSSLVRFCSMVAWIG